MPVKETLAARTPPCDSPDTAAEAPVNTADAGKAVLFFFFKKI